MKAKEIQLNETYLFVATDDAARKYLEGKPFTPTHVANGWTPQGRNGLHKREAKRFFDYDNNKALPEELQPLPAGFVYPGMRFEMKDFEGTATIDSIDEAKGVLSVILFTDNVPGGWKEDDWNLEQTKFNFEQGSFWEVK